MTSLFKHNTITSIIIAITCLIFIFVGYEAVEYGIDWYAFIPLLALALMFMVMQFHYTLFVVALLTPFSLFTKYEVVSVTLPTEPMLLFMMVVFLFELSLQKHINKKIFTNLVSVCVIASLVWIIISSCFSTDLFVSFKHILARLWFVIPCYFMALFIFKDSKKILWFIACYGFSLSVVIIISTIKYALKGFDHDYADYIMMPFYSDHTAYGAAIGLLLPISLYYLFSKKTLYNNMYVRVLFAFISICLIVGFVFSYARATWISIVLAGGILLLIKLKLKKRTLIGLGIVGALLIVLSWNFIIGKMSENSQDSSGNISEHIQSMSNISTDASNTERLNRWACALQMTKERPLVGWGFGTYQFEYGRFQKSKDLTIISTNEGTLGNAHSEYLGPLCETGILGMLTMMMIFGATIYIGIRAYYRIKDRDLANLCLFITISLITYYIHGIMNNFLDTDKLAIPFWAMTSMVVALDLYSIKKEKEENLINNIQKEENI